MLFSCISGNPYLLHFSLRDSVYRGLEKGNKIKHRMCIFLGIYGLIEFFADNPFF